jgi:ubiquinol-cytochrome c reductase iron-sulfur subunit
MHYHCGPREESQISLENPGDTTPMNNDGVDKRRRRLLIATSAVGGLGVVGGLWPFVASMQPSAKAQSAGAPVEVDISKLEPGQLVTVQWRGKPVWVLRRTEKTLNDLKTLEGDLRDPHSEVADQQPPYAANDYRSLKPEVLVVVGICTHLGCSPTYRPEIAPPDLGPDWKGGFFCPCHGSRFDLAGRVYKSVPAPTNLEVPPYTYLSADRILVGQDPSEGKFKVLSDARDVAGNNDTGAA